MAYVRVEFITLGIGPNFHGRHENVIDKLLASHAALSVGAAATAAGARPTAPTSGERIHARITATTGKLIAAWGADPAASQSNGIALTEGATEVVPVAAGDKLSFIELAEA